VYIIYIRYGIAHSLHWHFFFSSLSISLFIFLFLSMRAPSWVSMRVF
jgi:hypothetical protein